ncbi:MAG TPA: hypothetical protein VGM77_13370 [Gemmatimonadales bacterium]|jgi:hypothetical protein
MHHFSQAVRRSVQAVIGLGIAAVAGPLSAQGNSACTSYAQGLPGGPSPRNVCNAAVDGAVLFTPVAGILVTGGNPFLGSTGGLGGLPHLGITLRVNATKLVVPDLNYNGAGTTVAAHQQLIAPAPLVEAALGILRGGHGGALALDALGSGQLLPTKLLDDVHVDINARRIGSIALGLGYGARLTLIGDHGAVPAVTVSIMRRTLPRIGVGDLAVGDRYAFASDLRSTDYRITIGKHLSLLSLSAGVGRNHYRAATDLYFVDPLTGISQPPIHVDIDDTRDMGFVDAGLAAGPFYLIAEAGLQRGKDLGLVTTFAGNDPAANRLFGSLGLRIGR